MLLNVNASRSLTKQQNSADEPSYYGSKAGIGGISVNHATTVQIEDGRGDAPIHLDDLNAIAKLTHQERQQAYSFEDRKRSNNEKSLAFQDDDV